MRSNNLFPKEFVQSSLEFYIFRISKKSTAIYQILVFCLILVFASLPFIEADVTTIVLGQIDTNSGNYILSSPISGEVIDCGIYESMTVNKGDTLMQIRIDQLILDKERISELINDETTYQADLKALLLDDNPNLKSSKYQLIQIEYSTKKLKYEESINEIEKSFRRKQTLYAEEVIALQEFEEIEARANQAQVDLLLFEKQQKTLWKKELIDIQESIKNLRVQLSKLEEAIRSSVLLSPANGYLQYVQPISRNQFIQAGVRLAELSPLDEGLAICWVSPMDIGLLNVGDMGLFRIDAFNYNHWGFAHGEIVEISNDAYIIENQPYFKVKCKLDKDFLQLSSGQKGQFKKGMTFTATFQVARRTLFQLLYDEMDDWMNPQIQQANLN